ncbi:acyl-CoA dehydrogenase family protein [Burkholderia thailandensis]|uniref:Acyl-CoA dehydrogenase family protein n=1 Tax=Burkholderia thailandensis (strain ATCC 700388 / DSM 13276 / CCUG 48851 / CIP 106301 / E264) TaxID=271848 RepID=Q2T5H4_BURTA|nr:acyl-CoA dehydrogenase family protein [Burkholderia thailandensis]ABC36037.1 acyl-CoA dehydrogenase family protein [Burkholderia thailandensis E264]AHI76892.1 acyl-CoA dehydrogenase, N-terminal domain protein [Burkholderia thailandensis 2002721723]AHI82752.1 acyl-CoA dehydrogenase, N-terminal domain protein [Burkholderia thailandensis E444]AIC89962.1 acyl-CoA dehydrogenase, N-terminal domain protein [Burkholderia thailandensis USAMRU Malaysia \
MSHALADPAISTGTDYASLAARFRPIFARIAEGAIERDRTRALPHEPIRWLKEAGFGAVRVPVHAGGAGASIPQLVQLLIELGAADSNLPQALRGHFAFVEDWLNAPAASARQAWFDRFASGQLVGNAWTEVGDVALGEVRTKVAKRDGRWIVNGEKYYSTGAIFADWIDVYAQRADDGSPVIAAVATHQEGVIRDDDWDGFGQATTGSGTTRFVDAHVDEANVIDFARRFKYQTAFYQLFHLATLAGIGRAVERDASALVRERTRIYSHGNGPRVSDDAQILQVVGEISAWAYAAEAIALRAAQPSQRAYEAHFGGEAAAEHDANIAAEIESAQGQLVVSELVLRAATHLFDALGASATSASKALDRHWRNARTVASHNPLVYKARIVGERAVNGTAPPYVWQIGAGPGKPQKHEKAA